MPYPYLCSLNKRYRCCFHFVAASCLLVMKRMFAVAKVFRLHITGTVKGNIFDNYRCTKPGIPLSSHREAGTARIRQALSPLPLGNNPQCPPASSLRSPTSGKVFPPKRPAGAVLSAEERTDQPSKHAKSSSCDAVDGVNSESFSKQFLQKNSSSLFCFL